ncbi:hypothetical protein LTR84_006657 [Exophiala bonariae]|uniref:Uncharacterized protein n=1 Tax=Exophiala bonariae TaxID=1690606 RepID=A0AAV9N109_9EURO|nr:hypothetical protein LTR84_006657 [Exophiala bonariae]
MVVSPASSTSFSRGKLLTLVANARKDFLQKDRDQNGLPWFSDGDEEIEKGMSDCKLTPASNDPSRRTTLPTKKRSHKRKLTSTRDPIDFSSSPRLGERSQTSCTSTSQGSGIRRHSYQRNRPGTDPMDFTYPSATTPTNTKFEGSVVRRHSYQRNRPGTDPMDFSYPSAITPTRAKVEDSALPSAGVTYPKLPLSGSISRSSGAYRGDINTAGDSSSRRLSYERIRPPTASSKETDRPTSPSAGKNEPISPELDFSSTPNDTYYSSDNIFIPEQELSPIQNDAYHTNDNIFISDEDYDCDSPDVEKVQHKPGQNDMMSGAVGLGDTPLLDNAYQGNNVMYWGTAREAAKEMPLKVVTKQTLRDMFLPGNGDDECWSMLPSDFLIAMVGIGSAAAEVEEAKRSGRIVTSGDTMFALAKRGGTCDDDVVYPENIKPLIGSDEEGFDEQFWLTMWREGERWRSDSNKAVF